MLFIYRKRDIKASKKLKKKDLESKEGADGPGGQLLIADDLHTQQRYQFRSNIINDHDNEANIEDDDDLNLP